MADDFSGTNSEKIDKLVQTVIELRTTLRLCFALIGFGFPLMVSLLAFLVLQSFSTAAKVDRINDQVSNARGDYERLNERVYKLERQEGGAKSARTP